MPGGGRKQEGGTNWEGTREGNEIRNVVFKNHGRLFNACFVLDLGSYLLPQQYLGRRVHAGWVWSSRVNDAAAVGHLILVGILDGVVVVEGMNDAQVENQLVQHPDQTIVAIWRRRRGRRRSRRRRKRREGGGGR